VIDADLTDAEIDNICDGLTQNAAKVRFLKDQGFHVRQKPNGRPLINRKHYDGIAAGKPAEDSEEPAWTVPA
jgi:hypothetical protein